MSSWQDLVTREYETVISSPSLPELHKAASAGDVLTVQTLIQQGVNLNEKYQEVSSLHLAVFKNNVEVTRVLVESGADVEATGILNQTPLHVTKIPSIAMILLKAGADAKAVDFSTDTPLHTTNNSDVAQILIGAGADVNAENRFRATPLHTASNAEIARVLVDHGALVDARDGMNRTPMQFAINHHLFNTASFLIKIAATQQQQWAVSLADKAEAAHDEYVKKTILDLVADLLSDHPQPLEDKDVLELSFSNLDDSSFLQKIQDLPNDFQCLALFINHNENLKTLPDLNQFSNFQSLFLLFIENTNVNTLLGLPKTIEKFYCETSAIEVLGEKCFHKNTFEVLQRALKDAKLYDELKQPPQEVFSRGLENVSMYFQRGKLLNNSRYRLAAIGETGAGKSSLIESLISGKPYLTAEADRTHVMDLRKWKVNESDFYNIYDQGGHEVYDITNPFFISLKSMVFIVHSLKSRKKIDRCLYILRNTLHQHPENSIYFALTHLDEVADITKESEHFQRKVYDLLDGEIDTFHRLLRNPKNKGHINEKDIENMLASCEKKKSDIKFFLLSSKSYSGFEDLKQFLINKIEKQRVHIPMQWIDSSNVMSSGTQSFWTKPELLRKLNCNEKDLIPCLQYLSDTGMVIWNSDNVLLENYIFHDIEFVVKVLKSIFHHDLRSSLQDENLSDIFTETELDHLITQFQEQGILTHEFLRVMWQKYDLKNEDEKALIELIKVFHIFNEINKPEDVLETQYFVPWYIRENQAPENFDVNNPFVLKDNVVALNMECLFHNKLPINVSEFYMVELQKYAVDQGYLGKRYAWCDGLQINLDELEITTFRKVSESSLSLVVKADFENLLEMWDRLQSLNESLESILKSWHGALRSLHSNCGPCTKTSTSPPHRWLLKEVLPKKAFKDMLIYCSTEKCKIPAALVTKMPTDSTEDIEERIKTVAEFLGTPMKRVKIPMKAPKSSDSDIKSLFPTPAQSSRQLYDNTSLPPFADFSSQMVQLGSHLSSQNRVLSEQMYLQSQQMSTQMAQHHGQMIQSQQSLAQQSQQQAYHNQYEVQSQMQQLYLQNQYQSYVQSQALAHQFAQGHSNLAQQSYAQHEQLTQETQAQGQALRQQIDQTHQDVIDVARLEAGDASGLQLNLQHPILQRHQQDLINYLEPNSDLLNNLFSYDILSLEEKQRIEGDKIGLGRVKRILRQIDGKENANIKLFMDALSGCRPGSSNSVLATILKQSELELLDAPQGPGE